jgi:hypothetical protein
MVSVKLVVVRSRLPNHTNHALTTRFKDPPFLRIESPAIDPEHFRLRPTTFPVIEYNKAVLATNKKTLVQPVVPIQEGLSCSATP